MRSSLLATTRVNLHKALQRCAPLPRAMSQVKASRASHSCALSRAANKLNATSSSSYQSWAAVDRQVISRSVVTRAAGSDGTGASLAWGFGWASPVRVQNFRDLGIRRSYNPAIQIPQQASQTVVLSVEGMMCDGCTSRVQAVLEGMDGVNSVQVDLEGHQATVKLQNADSEMAAKLAAAVTEIGFETKVKA